MSVQVHLVEIHQQQLSLALKSETWILFLGLIDLSDDDGCMEPPRAPYTPALVILPSPTSLFPTTPSSLHQSSNVPSFINLVHVLARMNLWYFPSCLCEATSKWWFTKTPPLLFEIFFAPLLLFSHLYPWQSQSCSYQALAHRIRCLVWLVLTMVSSACRSS